MEIWEESIAGRGMSWAICLPLAQPGKSQYPVA